MARDDSILPDPGKYLTNNLKELYADAISQLISDLGREVTLHLPPIESGCPNCKYLSVGGRGLYKYNSSNPFSGPPYNVPFADGQRCPVCRGTHIIHIPRQSTWHATIVKRPRDYDYEFYGVSPENVVLTKFLVEAWDDVNNCIRATIDGLDYERLSEPVKIGLGNNPEDLKFINVFWKRVT
ncbi:MAG: hypothetical protein DRP85_00775 [Candidatus Makaraimicrobium thalassicum]|nr:MAG: hypothetical protein DRP85_00775 [Candidatus Omnitrophota bacterium]